MRSQTHAYAHTGACKHTTPHHAILHVTTCTYCAPHLPLPLWLLFTSASVTRYRSGSARESGSVRIMGNVT